MTDLHPSSPPPVRSETSFLEGDGGRSGSRRPRQRMDCTVRALAVACGIPYDRAYDVLKKAGRRSGRGFGFRAWAEKAEVEGMRLVWTPLPAVKGHRRMTPERFPEEHSAGRHVLKTARHVMACVDGVVHDESRPREGRCVYGFWTVVPAPR